METEASWSGLEVQNWGKKRAISFSRGALEGEGNTREQRGPSAEKVLGRERGNKGDVDSKKCPKERFIIEGSQERKKRCIKIRTSETKIRVKDLRESSRLLICKRPQLRVSTSAGRTPENDQKKGGFLANRDRPRHGEGWRERRRETIQADALHELKGEDMFKKGEQKNLSNRNR